MARELQRPAVLVHVADDVVRCALGHLRLDLERDLYLGTVQALEVRHHLVGDSARVAADALWIEDDGPMEGLELRCGRRSHRGGGASAFPRLLAAPLTRSLLGRLGLRLRLDLPSRRRRAHEKTSVVVRDRDVLPDPEATVAPRRLVVAVGVSEGILLPGDESHAFPYGVDQNARVLQPRQIDVAGEVVDELLDGNALCRVAAPERDLVQLHAKPGA